jgi:hypothetical protein
MKQGKEPMSTDEKILQALTDQGKLLAAQGEALATQGKLLVALQTDMTSVKAVQQEQGGVLANQGAVLTEQGKVLAEHGTYLKDITSKLTRVEKDIQLVLKYHDENVLHLRSRIERIEEHTGLDKS